MIWGAFTLKELTTVGLKEYEYSNKIDVNEVFMFRDSMDIVSIVADMGNTPLVVD